MSERMLYLECLIVILISIFIIYHTLLSFHIIDSLFLLIVI